MLMDGDCGRLGSGLCDSGIVPMVLRTGMPDPLCGSGTVAARWRTGMELGVGSFSGGSGRNEASVATSLLGSRSRVEERDDVCEESGGGGGEDGCVRDGGACNADTLVGVEFSCGDG